MKTKKPLYKRWWVWLIALVIIGIALSGSDDEGKDAVADGKDVTPVVTTPEPKPEEEEPEEDILEVGIGVPAEIADVSFMVNSIEETNEIKSSNQFVESAKTEGKYIIIDVTVKNEKKESITIHSSYFKLITQDGVEYDPSTDGAVMMAMMDEEDFFLQQVNPGLSKTGKVVFEVGADLDLNTAVLRGQTGFWGTESVEISLKQ